MNKDYLKNTFLRLVKYDTQSNPDSTTYPSTSTQTDFAKLLAKELKEIGLKEVEIDSYSYVTAFLPANNSSDRTIGFISHMDTSSDCSGKNISPVITENYNGGNISLNNGIILSKDEFKELSDYIGKTIITSDGTTLLGADDKAGISEILTAVKHFVDNPDIPHCNIKIAFTPDEEIGAGTEHFDVEKFSCDFAYTIDGGILGEFSFENFNAARAKIKITGRSVHPGSAFGVMKNAGLIANEIALMLPTTETPTATKGREGFYHLVGIEGSVETASLNYIIRDFDKASFEKRKENISSIINEINLKYGDNTAVLELHDEYYNMKEIIDKNKLPVDLALSAFEKAELKPRIEPIRGGTDGAMLSYKGLPCPNLFTGGHNFHGPYEYICLESMEKAVEVIINIATLA